MIGAARIRSVFVGSDGSLAERMRLRRWDMLRATFPDLGDMRVLDLGGTAVFWERAPVRPKSVTVINLAEQGDGMAGVVSIQGDVCDAGELVDGQTFDLTFSNSLIEHLGGHDARARFAEVVRSMAPRYVVQTPYRYFPIEPHWVCPGMQFMPRVARYWLAPRWPLGHTYRWRRNEACEEVRSIELLTMTQMREYFPEARITWERFLGIPKSMSAFRVE